MKHKIFGGVVIICGLMIFAFSAFFIYHSHKVTQREDVPERFFGSFEEAQDYQNDKWKVTVRPDMTSEEEAKIVFIQRKDGNDAKVDGVGYIITKTDHFDENVHNYTTRRFTK